MSGIRFCDDCGNILHAREAKDEHKLLFYCKSCSSEVKIDILSTDDSKSNIISQKDFIQSTQDALVDENFILDPSMPREKVLCPRCGFSECAVIIVKESNDTRLKKVYICGSVNNQGKPKCKKKFEPVKYVKSALQGETFSYREVSNEERSKRVLLFLHGNYTSSYIFERILSKFENGEDHEFRVIAPDLRGFGQSSYNKSLSKFDDLVQDMENFLKEIKVEVCYVVGWDIGAAIAIKLAAAKKIAVTKLFLVNPVGIHGKTYCRDPYDEDNFIPEWTDMIDENDQRVKNLEHAFKEKDKMFFEGFYKDEFFNELMDYNRLDSYIEQFMSQQNFGDFIKCQLGINLESILGDIEAQTLIWAGREDKRTSWEDAKELQKKIPGSRIRIFEDGGHALILEKQDDFIEELKEFCGFE